MGRKEQSRASHGESSAKRGATPQAISGQTPCCGQKASSCKRPQDPVQPNEVNGRPEGWRAQSPVSFQREVRDAIGEVKKTCVEWRIAGVKLRTTHAWTMFHEVIGHQCISAVAASVAMYINCAAPWLRNMPKSNLVKGIPMRHKHCIPIHSYRHW